MNEKHEIDQRLPRFALESSQCELLLAFEASSSLSELSKIVLRDASVVSRQLQKLAETAPVIEKQKGKWVLTDLGKRMNEWARHSVQTQAKLLQQSHQLNCNSKRLLSSFEKSALILVGVQNGFSDPVWGSRNNLNAEENMEALLRYWRRKNWPVFHIQHRSKEPTSPLRSGTHGADFKEFATPIEDEVIVQKSTNSSFVGTDLEAILRKDKIDSLVVCGFSTNHCIDATVRNASDLGFNVFLVEDSIVSYDRIGPDGRQIKAQDIHDVVVSNLSQEFALVIKAQDFFKPNTSQIIDS